MHVLTSDDILSLERLPRQLMVVGAGIIGIEYASMFAALGIDVTLVDKRTTSSRWWIAKSWTRSPTTRARWA